MEKHLQIRSIKDTSTDLEYWISCSIQERIDAIEILRNQYIQLQSNRSIKDVQPRLQRIYRVTKQKQN